SPPDVCRFSLISTSLRSAADSDSVWAKFLPSDYPSIIAKSPTSIPDFRSLKDAYVYLADHPLLIDEGRKIFSLDKWTGKKCYFLGARDLNIVWSDTPDAWEWTCVPESRFPEVAQLKFVRWLQIWGTIRAGILSPLTSYTAYFVYKLEDDSYGFDTRHMEVSVGISGVESANVRIAFLHLNPKYISVRMYTSPYTPPSPYTEYCWVGPGWPGIDYDPPEDVDWDHHPSNLKLDKPVPKLRDDGWFELELGNCFTENEDDCIELRMEDVKTGCTKQGLIVEGIEIRPTIA
ncbi:putative F-box protein PP2-B12, partial [Solanum tuberosum]|uniref:putative F-box protein PP2-B12 n=1 Tax=Solanum tuberosum TaxID=4113 RepID=UPI0003D25D89